MPRLARLEISEWRNMPSLDYPPLAFVQSPAEVVASHLGRQRLTFFLTESKKSPRMYLQPLLQCLTERSGHRDLSERLFLAPVLLFLADDHFVCLEVQVLHLRTEDLASPGSGEYCEAEHGIHPRKPTALPAVLDESQQFFQFGQREKQAVPQFCLLVLVELSSLDFLLNLLPGHEGKFLGLLGIVEVLHRDRGDNEALAGRPMVPDTCERSKLLLDSNRTNVLS